MTATIEKPTQRLKLFLQGQLVIPASVVDLDSYCDWRRSPDSPQEGEIAFLDSGIWVDLTMEEFLTHNQVKAAFDFAIMSVVQPASLGRYVPDRMLLKNVDANLSAEPDGLFFKWETMRSGRLRLVDNAGQGFMELEGTPDMTLEVVSKTSVPKDTVLLRDLYWKAGIAEYWLVDVRAGRLSFEILQWAETGYENVPWRDGWVSSNVFAKKFQMEARIDPLGHPQFFVLSADF
jgi:Uma2 family endonuclease